MKKLIALLFVVLFAFQLTAQNPENRYLNQKSFGIMLQYGFNFYDLPENVGYKPLLLCGYFHFPLFDSESKFNLALDIIPQIGLAFTDKINLELGSNLYVNTSYALSENDILSFNIGSGPHFVNVETTRQAKGYIFSDNFLLAYKRKLTIQDQPYEFSIYSGFRHISNAGLQKPNNGIDNIMTGLGFARIISP